MLATNFASTDEHRSTPGQGLLRRVGALALAAGLALGTLGGPQGAAAQSEDRTIAELRVALDLLEENGYSDVKEIERDGSIWEVEARNRDGQWYDIDIDAAGETILRERPD